MKWRWKVQPRMVIPASWTYPADIIDECPRCGAPTQWNRTQIWCLICGWNKTRIPV